MKKLIYVILITLIITLPCFTQVDTEREMARTQEYIAAATQQGAAKISALKAYLKKFPDTSKKWTKLAYYQLTVENFQTKNFAEAAKQGEKTLSIGAPGDGEEARLYLIVANCYGIKTASIFNKDKALKMAVKAVSFAQSKKLNDVLAEAKKLKKQLAGPPPKKITPEQQIKMYYSDGEYASAVSYYRKLGAADKANVEIEKIYANSLLKSRRYDSALKAFQALFSKDQKAVYAFRMADIYERKARRDKKLVDNVIDAFLEAHLLYKKEGNGSNSKAAYGKAKYQLYEKHGYNAKIKKYNRMLQTRRNSAQKNQEAIRAAKKAVKKQERHIYRTYESEDMSPPSYELDKLKKLKNKLVAVESGAPAGASDVGDKLEEENKKILQELKDRLTAAKKKLGV
ncbi:MAG: tetratricopeptide repeat protein [bacterium]|nr:tetratricopeptide repeat protein [bacterium]